MVWKCLVPKGFLCWKFHLYHGDIIMAELLEGKHGCTCVIAAGETENAKFKVSVPREGLGLPNKALKENKEGRKEGSGGT